MRKVNILGADYEIVYHDYNEDKDLENLFGYVDYNEHRIVIGQLKTHKEWENESEESVLSWMKQTIRHEIVHAFLYESGLHGSSLRTEHWAVNEEMVDWIAVQGAKLVKAWEDADAL